MANGQPGDWDTGVGDVEDGPYINKPDEGNSYANYTGNAYASSKREVAAYYGRGSSAAENGQTYSPNRQIASAVAFGSLPSGIEPSGANEKPWQTLLFCTNPAASLKHPGFGVSNTAAATGLAVPLPPYTTIPDHYLLDLFTMPIVEPYAISEPLSSQGKVNMNYQMAPFTYIERDTALRGVLRGTRMTAIPSSAAVLAGYKSADGVLGNGNIQFRYAINPDESTGTLRAFEDRFNQGELFRSASEICSIPLVPETDPKQTYDPSVPTNVTNSSLQSFWNACKLTGDNLREEPYNDLYPRLTTKSNTYTVHVRVQTLKKVPGSSQSTFVDPTDTTTTTGPKDTITAEYRGSYQIERYVDPNVPTTGADASKNFPDYALNFPNTPPISKFYKFHTIGTRQF